MLRILSVDEVLEILFEIYLHKNLTRMRQIVVSFGKTLI